MADDDEKTTITVSVEAWKELNSMKGPGDTFEDVIWRIVEEEESDDSSQ